MLFATLGVVIGAAIAVYALLLVPIPVDVFAVGIGILAASFLYGFKQIKKRTIK